MSQFEDCFSFFIIPIVEIALKLVIIIMLRDMSKTSLVKLCITLFWGIVSFAARAQVTAAFSADVTEGCSPLVVQFINQSTGSNLSYYWTLGDPNGGCNTGPTSILKDPGRIFTIAGSYCVCLTVTDPSGVSDTECSADMINFSASIEADFVGSVLEGCAPLTVDFSDISIPGTGTIVSRQWDLNNGNCQTSSSPTISCTYDMPGIYDVSLIVQDDDGCFHFVEKENYITVSEIPTSDFVVDETSSCQIPFTVNFDPVLTNTTDIAFQWDFGDNNISNQENPSHTYTTTGDYSVSLITLNSAIGCSDTTILTDLINLGNLVDFSYTPTSGCTDLTVDFTDLTAGSVTNWLWDFGNGIGTSTNPEPTYTYSVPGCYTVTLTATSDGCTEVRTSSNCIEVLDVPTGSYTTTNLLGCNIPHTSTFIGSSNLPNSTYSWDFGDGQTSSLQNINHTYTGYGVFPVSLTVTSPNGCENTVVLDTVKVEELIVNIVADSTDGCVPLTIGLTAISNLLVPITSVDWDFGNGTTNSGLSTSVMYADTGTYIISTIVTNTEGCVDTVLLEVEAGEELMIDFEANPTTSCAKDPISFTDLTIGEIDEWFWDFGDGGTSAMPTPEYKYQDIGVFTVCLTVVNNGCENVFCKEDYITILPPIAKFSLNRNCDNPYSVEFEDISIGADSWSWDFGLAGITTDTSSLQNPTFVFPSTGLYSVTLVVINDSAGCADTIVRPVRILEPIPNFEILPDTGCAVLNVNVMDLSQDADEYEWLAPGADIQPNANSPNPTFVYQNGGVYTGFGLIIEDRFGCLDTLMTNDTVLVSDIEAGFSSTFPKGCLPLSVDFIDTSNTFGANLVSWLWDFGDGGTSNLQNPTHIYTSKGKKDVILTVTNALGCSSTMTMTDYVFSTLPNLKFTSDTILCTGQSFTFNNTSGVTSPSTYLWDFGDGNSSTLKNPTHTYSNEGVFDICLTAIDRFGCDSTLCKPNFIRVTDPVANFSADTTYATCPPLSVNFSDLSNNGIEWIWAFGDSSANVISTNTTHIYTEPGSYDVCLIITSPSGCLDTLCKEDYIVIDGPMGDFNFAPDQGCAPLEVTFVGTGIDIVKFTWDNGYGDIVVNNNTSGTDSATFVYDEAVISYPILVLEDNQGCQRTYISPDPVVVDQLNVSILNTPTSYCGSATVTFESDIVSNISQVQYLWMFPGGIPSESTNPSELVTYSSIGNYDVSLIVTNGMCSDTITQSNIVTISDIPVANFGYTTPSSCSPSTYYFSDSSTVNLEIIDSWIWDFGTGDSSLVQNPDYTFVNAGSYTVSLTVISSAGCENTITKEIEVFPLPAASAGPDASICIGQSTQLNGSGTGTYQWSPANGLNCTNCPAPIADPVTTTNYILTVTSLDGCQSVDTTMVNVIPFPTPDISLQGDTTVCTGSFVQLFATSSQGGVFFDWDSTRLGLSCYHNCFNPFASPIETTTYVVTVTNQGGCTKTDSITVVVLENPVDIAGADRTICKGDEVTLSATTGANPTWSSEGSLSCTTCANPIASPDESTEYYLEITTDEGCQLTDTIIVYVFDSNGVNAGEDKMICVGDSVQLDATGTGNIVWIPSNTMSDNVIENPVVYPAETTTYIMTVTNDLCETKDSVVVYVRKFAEIEVEDQEICVGENITLTATGNVDGYSWSGDDISNLTTESIVVEPLETTTYTIIGTLGSCLPDTTTATVIVNEPPELEGQSSYGFFPGEDVEIGITATGNGGFTYNWSPDEFLSCASCPSPFAMPDTSTILMVEVVDVNGCVSYGYVNLMQKNSCINELIIPNAFTPNGDGLNDILYVRGSAINTIDLFRVYDRWGALVFETTDMGTGWDGTSKGKPLNPGVFVYYVEAPCMMDGSKLMKKGNITLIR